MGSTSRPTPGYGRPYQHKRSTPAPLKGEKIESHANWYTGRWIQDRCHCGNYMQVPAGTKGVYQCNECAYRTETGLDY